MVSKQQPITITTLRESGGVPKQTTGEGGVGENGGPQELSMLVKC